MPVEIEEFAPATEVETLETVGEELVDYTPIIQEQTFYICNVILFASFAIIGVIVSKYLFGGVKS